MTSYRRVDEAPPVDRPCLHVSWARLAILWWRDVPVVTAESVELNELDKFVVSAVGRLGHLHSQAFEEFTGLPPLVFNGLARRLHSLGLLEWRDGVLRRSDPPGRSEPDGTASRSGTATLDFLYLPETDDLVVVDTGLADWEKAAPAPVGAAPLPEALHGTTVRTLLQKKIERREVLNLPKRVIMLADGDDEALTEMAGASPQPAVPVCPVFRCAATVVLDRLGPAIQLDVKGDVPGGRSGEQEVRVTLDLSGAVGLVELWSRGVTEFADNPDETATAMQALGLVESPWPAVRWDEDGNRLLAVDGRQADILAPSALLTRPIGLEVRQRHAHVTVALQLEPADERAGRMIKLDSILQELLQKHSTPGWDPGLRDLDASDVGGVTALRARAWHLKYYTLVHAIREAEDFDYV
jgi:hypothetical protein